ncbi:transmembrane protein 65 isoform 1-T4 [Molossus nigricans]
MPAQPGRALSASISTHRGGEHASARPHNGRRRGPRAGGMRLRGPAPPRPLPSPRPVTLIPPLAVSAAAAAGERGRFRGRRSLCEWEQGRARGWESRRERRAAPEEGGAWLTHPSGKADRQTNARGTRPPAPLLHRQEAPARTARPPARGSPGPAASDKLFPVRGTGAAAGPLEGNRDGRGGESRAGPGSAWCPAPRLPIWRTSGRGRLSPAPSSSLSLARNRPPDCRRGPRAPARHVPAAAAAAELDRAQSEAGPGRRAPPAVLVWLRAGAAGARVPRRLPRRAPGAGHPPQGAHGGAEHGAGRARLYLQPALHRAELPAQGAAPLRVHRHRPSMQISQT